MLDFTPELLLEARTLAGMTTAQLSAAARLSHSQVIRYEGGLRPSAESWARLVAVLRSALVQRARSAEKMHKRLAA